MIEVKITDNGLELGRITFVERQQPDERYCNYIVQFGVERFGPQRSVGLYTRTITEFPRLEYNVLALISDALNQLSNEELKLDQPTDPADLAWGFRGPMRQIQAWADRLRHH